MFQALNVLHLYLVMYYRFNRSQQRLPIIDDSDDDDLMLGQHEVSSLSSGSSSASMSEAGDQEEEEEETHPLIEATSRANAGDKRKRSLPSPAKSQASRKPKKLPPVEKASAGAKVVLPQKLTTRGKSNNVVLLLLVYRTWTFMLPYIY